MDLHSRGLRALQAVLLLLLAGVPVDSQEAAGCNVTVGIYAIYGPQAAYKAWNATFEQYLATELYPQFNCTFTVVPLLTETAVYNAVGNATIDFIYSNSGMHVCLEEQYQVTSIASLISWQANADAVSYGAAVVTLANRTDINALQDVVGKTVEIGSLSLVAGWEAQVYALQSAGIDLFVSAKQVFYLQNIEQGVDDLLDGLADIIFVRADLLENMQAQGLVTVSSFKVVAQTYIAGYPWPVTAPLGLFPEYSLDCLPHVGYGLRKAITEALFRINRSDYPAQAGGYAGWTTPYSYNTVRTLQQDIGLLRNGSCLRSNEIEDLITCAAGQIKLPLDQLRMQCAREGLHCPEGYGCFCSPCIPQPPSAAASAFGGLRVSGFAVIMTVIPSLIVVAILLEWWQAQIDLPTALAVVLQGVGGHGFDKLTKTSTVAKLLQNLDAASLEPYVQRLQDHFCQGSKSGSDGGDDQEMEKARQVAVEQLCNMAAIRTVPASVKTGVLKFLAVHAFFVVDKAALGKGKAKEVKAALEAQPAPSAATRQVCAARLIALLDSATKAAQAPPGPVPVNIKRESKSKKRKAAELVADAAPATTSEAVQAARLETPFLTETVAFVSKAQRTAGVSLAAELPEEMDAALSQLRESEALAATKLAAGATGVQAQQVRSMVGLMRWLQLYILSDPAAAQPDVAADLQGVFSSAFTKTKPAADEPHWMDVLVDILLSLLGRSGDALPFGPLREACEALFRAFAEQVTSQGFADLVRVVQQPPEGQADEEEDEDVFEDHDAAMLAGTAEGTDDDAEDHADSEDDEADGTALPANAESSGSDSSDEEDFDDDQMFKMDDKIAAALRVMARGGANARESREAIATFKFRVIGLMEIYIKKVPSSPLLAAALPALLGALTGACQQGGDAALAKRLHVLLMLFTKAHVHSVPSASGETGTVPDGEAMAGLLKRTLYLASRHKDKKVTSAAATAFAYLLRCSVTAEGNPTDEATTAVKAALDDFFTKKKSRLHRKLFEDIMSRCALLSAATLLPSIVQHENTARSGHVKADAIALLLAFLRSSKGQQSAGSIAEAFRRHVSVLAGLAADATTGSVAQSARQNEALKDICASFEQLVKIYPTESLQDVVGQHQIQLVLASVHQAEAAAPKPKVQVQLKRLAHLLSEKISTVPFSQHVKSNGSKKANKKPNIHQSLPAVQPKAKAKVHKKKKASNGQSKSSLAQAAPKIAKNKDKYKKKGNKDMKKGKRQS